MTVDEVVHRNPIEKCNISGKILNFVFGQHGNKSSIPFEYNPFRISHREAPTPKATTQTYHLENK